jgi:hypothetical protein
MSWQGLFVIARDEEKSQARYWAGQGWTRDADDAICFDDAMNAIDYVIYLGIVDRTLVVEGNSNRWLNSTHLMRRKVLRS